MSVPQEEGAWLEAANGRRYPIKGNCSLGRSGANTIVLQSPKVSRRHALIHLQNIGELWLIDFGSSNGNFFQQAANSSPDSTQRWRSNHNWRSGFQGSAAGRNFRSIQNGGHATDVPGDRRYSLLASCHRPSRVYTSQPANAKRGSGPPPRSVDF